MPQQPLKQNKHKGDGHRKRLREKFLESGLSGFHDYEVIELLLTLCTPRKDCKAPAKDMLNTFSTLQGVFEASLEDLQKIDGIGPVNVLGIKLVKEAAERYLDKKVKELESITNKEELIRYLNYTIRDKAKEHFVVIYLNAKNKVITSETASTGTLTSSSVYPREIVTNALGKKAAALIFAHNHPSGDPAPSRDDINITRKLFSACRLMGITVHDHLIIAEKGHYSFAEKGLMEQFNHE
jgi:DNA repair protein RadC